MSLGAARVLAAVLVLAACRDKPAKTDDPGTPQRIISQTVDADETLWALGQDVRGRVVGVSKMADDRRYSTVANVWPASVPRVAGTSEALIAARPDLVLIAEFSAAQTRSLLEHTGVPTVVLSGYDSFDDYRARVRAIATAVGDVEGGEGLVADFDTRLHEVSEPPGPDAPSIISYVEGNVPAAGTTFDEEATAAGFVNLPAKHGLRGHQQVGVEQIVAWDPDFIVVQCGPDDCAQRSTAFAVRPGIASTRAAKAGHVFAIESSLLLSTGATMPGVVERLRQQRGGPG